MLSLFQCPDPSRRDEQELQNTYSMAWVPLICTVTLLYSAKLLGKYGPDPENLDRNLVGLKITMWIYAFVELALDKDMVLKRGPALYVAIIFCACDMLRFHMEATRLIYEDEELEEEIDRLANMAITALATSEQVETAFKHVVREVQTAIAMQDIVDEAEDGASSSPYERINSAKLQLSDDEDEKDTSDCGTLAMRCSPRKVQNSCVAILQITDDSHS